MVGLECRHRLYELRYLAVELQAAGSDLLQLVARTAEPAVDGDRAGGAYQVDLKIVAGLQEP